MGVEASDIKVCCAAEKGDPDRGPKNPPISGDDDRATYSANAFDDCESGTGDMLRGGVGVEEPDEFVERGLSAVLTSDSVAESAAPSTMLKAVLVKGSDDLAVPKKQYLSTSS